MTDIMRIIESSNETNANIKFEITPEDLRGFAEELINRAVNEVAAVASEERNDHLLTKEEAKSLLGVCDSTLWHWQRRGYLVPIKIGTRVKYRESDVNRVLGKKNDISFLMGIKPSNFG